MKKPGKIVIVTVLALALLGGGWLTYKHVSNSSSTPKNQEETAQQRAQDSKKKAETIDDSKGSSHGTYTPPASSDGIDLTANQTNPTQVVVTTKLTGYSDGTCTLTVSNGPRTNSQNAQVIYQPTFSTCAGFTVPVASLGTGTWTLDLSVTSGGVTNQKSTILTVK